MKKILMVSLGVIVTLGTVLLASVEAKRKIVIEDLFVQIFEKEQRESLQVGEIDVFPVEEWVLSEEFFLPTEAGVLTKEERRYLAQGGGIKISEGVKIKDGIFGYINIGLKDVFVTKNGLDEIPYNFTPAFILLFFFYSFFVGWLFLVKHQRITFATCISGPTALAVIVVIFGLKAVTLAVVALVVAAGIFALSNITPKKVYSQTELLVLFVGVNLVFFGILSFIINIPEFFIIILLAQVSGLIGGKIMKKKRIEKKMRELGRDNYSVI